MLLTVRMEEFAGWTVLHAAGEIDMSSGPVLRNELISQINEGRIYLAINLGAVDFIDSTGLGVLIGGLKRARSRGGELKVVEVPDRINDVFDLTGLGAVFPGVATVADLPAIDSIGATDGAADEGRH